MIDDSLPLPYDEYPQEIDNYDIELLEDRSFSVFENHFQSDYYEHEMIEDRSTPTFDEYSPGSVCYDVF